jgi:transposase
MRRARAVALNDVDRQTLQSWSRSRVLPARRVLRAKIVLLAAADKQDLAIAETLRISRHTAALWRSRFVSKGVEGLLRDATRPSRIPPLSAAKERAIVEETLRSTPPDATHWSSRSMAVRHGVHFTTVARVWRRHNLKPHLVERFKLSKDPHFWEKLEDVVGLYLNPPQNALVLCVDEKSQIQALDRTRPVLPLRPGIPQRQTHDYIRNGTTTLFAALNMLEGTVIGRCMPRHRAREFLMFLKLIDEQTPANRDLHLIVDNYATHKKDRVQRWLRRHPRFHLHFVPTSSSWLNMVERWFGEITRKRIRRGTFPSVKCLVTAIYDYIKHNNRSPKPFVWTATVSSIKRKIGKCIEISTTGD